MSLTVISTHPIQYHAPVYRALEGKFGIPVTAIYGSDFSVVGYRDKGFDTDFKWDTDLLRGYQQIFLSSVKENGKCSRAGIFANGLREALRQTAPEAVLITGYGTYFYQKAFYEARRQDLPILFRGETIDCPLNKNWIKMQLKDLFLSHFYKRCSKLLYIGQNSYAHFRRLGCPEEKLIFSPYCVDVSPFKVDESARANFRFDIRRELDIAEDEMVLLFSGKLVKEKGITLFVNAARQLPEKIRKNIVIMFLGDGQLRKETQRQALKPPAVKTRFLGFKNQSQLSPYYHAADLLVLPSYPKETWGLVVNEALHHGLPCVVSETVGCAPDLITPGITGEIFKAGSLNGLTLAIQQALRLTGDLQIREKCRQMVAGYTMEKAAEGIANAYRAVLGF